MALQNTPAANRIHIGFFGLRNAGKSSLVNSVTNQELSVVSDTAGTTTDPVYKTMELLPLGPVMIVDTPGFDDVGELGEKRVKKTRQVLAKTDIAVLVTDAGKAMTPAETEMKALFAKMDIPYITAKNKSDISPDACAGSDEVLVSALTGEGIDTLIQKIASLAEIKEPLILRDLIAEGDTVVLVTPIDEAAPKGRIILPQQQVLRDVLDSNAVAVVTKENGYKALLDKQTTKPALVVCDSQVFGKISAETPEEIPLTSFSILMARMKGVLETAVTGAAIISELKDGDKVLICEGCTHHRQCNDIGTVKLPNLIRKHTGAKPDFEFTSGADFPEDLTGIKLIIHCGGCMITEKEVKYRMKLAIDEGIPFTNYGTAIAYMNGILNRSTNMLNIKP